MKPTSLVNTRCQRGSDLKADVEKLQLPAVKLQLLYLTKKENKQNSEQDNRGQNVKMFKTHLRHRENLR